MVNRKCILKQEKTIYVLVFIIPFLMGLGVDLYVPSLPMISSYFNSPNFLVQLTVSLYLLGYGIGQIILGVLSDSFGRRKILLISSIFFSLISLISILFSNIFVLEFGRFIQGICVAGLAVVARAMLVDIFSGIKLSKLSNYFTISWSLGPIIAPFIGSELTKYLGWKSNFYLFAIYGFIIFLYSYFNFKETNLNLSNFSIRKASSDILEISTNKIFVLTTIISALGYGVIVLFNTVGPFLVEVSLKYSVSSYGNITMLLGCAYFFGAMTNRLVITKFSLNQLLVFGLFSACLGSLIMLCLYFLFNLNILVILIPVFMIFYCIGFIVPNALTKTMNMFADKAGITSAIFGTITGIIVFLVTIYGGKINTNNQLQLALIYLILFLISIILFFIIKN